MYQFYFYVPADYLEQVKQAVFGAGAGKVGHYQNCCFELLGRGQYQPLPGSEPFIGESGKLSKVEEYKVEMVCEKENRTAVEKALLASHPYEAVAYGFILLETRGAFRNR